MEPFTVGDSNSYLVRVPQAAGTAPSNTTDFAFAASEYTAHIDRGSVLIRRGDGPEDPGPVLITRRLVHPGTVLFIVTGKYFAADTIPEGDGSTAEQRDAMNLLRGNPIIFGRGGDSALLVASRNGKEEQPSLPNHLPHFKGSGVEGARATSILTKLVLYPSQSCLSPTNGEFADPLSPSVFENGAIDLSPFVARAGDAQSGNVDYLGALFRIPSATAGGFVLAPIVYAVANRDVAAGMVLSRHHNVLQEAQQTLLYPAAARSAIDPRTHTALRWTNAVLDYMRDGYQIEHIMQRLNGYLWDPMRVCGPPLEMHKHGHSDSIGKIWMTLEQAFDTHGRTAGGSSADNTDITQINASLERGEDPDNAAIARLMQRMGRGNTATRLSITAREPGTKAQEQKVAIWKLVNSADGNVNTPALSYDDMRNLWGLRGQRRGRVGPAHYIIINGVIYVPKFDPNPFAEGAIVPVVGAYPSTEPTTGRLTTDAFLTYIYGVPTPTRGRKVDEFDLLLRHPLDPAMDVTNTYYGRSMIHRLTRVRCRTEVECF